MHIQRYDHKRRVYNEIFSWSHGIDVRTITDSLMVELVAEETYNGKRVLIQIKKLSEKKNFEFIESKIINIFGERAEKAFSSIKKYLESKKIGDQNAQNN